MEQFSEDTTSCHSKIPINVSKAVGSRAWGVSSRSDVYRPSSDATLFFTSLPVLPHDKLNLNNTVYGIQSVDDISSSLNKFHPDVEGMDLLEDVENQAIGSLLPDDEDELLAGIMDGFDCSGFPNQLDDLEESDLFGSGGGLELESDPQESLGKIMSKINLSEGVVGNGVAHYGFANGVGNIAGEHPYGEHPSRTLFVRNINSNVEDSELRTLFEQYGDIRTLYTACKHRGFVMISYYDIRAARIAMRVLQNKPLKRRKLDIHFSIPKDNPSDKDINQGTLVVFNLDPSVSNDDLRQIFGAYGEVKEIRETPHKRHHKFIEFYDVRAAEAALRSLNMSDIAGKRIKLEPSRPGGARRNLMLQLNQEPEQDESRSFRLQMDSSITNSPPGCWPLFGSPIECSPLQTLSHSPGFRSPSSTIGNNIPGLASSLHPQISNSARVAPIGNGRVSHVEHKFTNTNSNHGASIQQSHSFPEPKLNQYSGTMPSFGAASSNGSGIETLSGPQFLWGSPNLYPEQTNSSAWRTPSMGHPLTSSGQSHGLPFTNHHGSFLGSSQHYPRHHVGSAPAGVPLERQFGFYQDSPETSFMSPVIFGGMGLSHNDGSFLMNVGARAAVNAGAAVLGNISENGSPVLRMISLPRLSPVFLSNGHYPGLTPTSMEGFERGRSRRVENNVNQIDSKKQFQLDLDTITSGEDTRTTLMIKNIPNKYTSKMLLAAIDENHRGTYDFLYLPIDFKNKCNVGYAFINMLSPSHIVPFYEAFNGKKWEKFNSEKVASLAYARIQGKEALATHFQNSSLMNEDKRCWPILFHSDDSEAVDQIIPDHLLMNGLNIQVHQSNESRAGDSLGSPSEGSPDES
ncbi:protein MEI2-like 5 isoform X1 [Camellia sinensis]|uniref:protein MEI2-like 5 isoform X1 n=2 Tax=Camellia sinensis TaxID=4442 RepID=UPI001035D0F8|nr:protein MEI2-like 5 isoform X1 [Camellia sinensis]XP_028120084.1 protein MEI2-like 5 isoform X1 [Camellia sinensis]